MKTLLLIASALMVMAAAMLIADVGAAALWIAVIAVGIAVDVIVQAGACLRWTPVRSGAARHPSVVAGIT